MYVHTLYMHCMYICNYLCRLCMCIICTSFMVGKGGFFVQVYDLRVTNRGYVIQCRADVRYSLKKMRVGLQFKTRSECSVFTTLGSSFMSQWGEDLLTYLRRKMFIGRIDHDDFVDEH